MMKANPPKSNEEQYRIQMLKAFFSEPDFIMLVKAAKIRIRENQLGKNKLEEGFILYRAAKQIAKKLNKHDGWVKCIADFMVTGDSFDNPHSPIMDFGDGTNIDPETGEKIYSLIIFPSTSPDDVVRTIVAYKTEELKKKRRTPSRKTSRDDLVKELDSQGKSKASISNAIEPLGGSSYPTIYRILDKQKAKKMK